MPKPKGIIEAIRSGDIKAAKKCIDKLCAETTGCVSKSSPSNALQNAVLAASTLTDTTLLQYLLTKGAPVNFCGSTRTVVSRGGVSPVHVAVSSGSHDALELLLVSHADVHQKDSHTGNTPLHIAAAKCDAVATRMLLQHGADVRALNSCGQTALQIVSHYGHVELVRVLLMSGAEVYQPGQRGASPMHVAAAQGHVPLLDLFSHSADVNIRVVTNHCTEQAPLHHAAANAQLETVCFLIDKLRANLNVLDSAGRTPLHALLASPHSSSRCVRSKHDHVAVCELLLSRGVNVNVRDSNGQTALHLAACNQFHGAIKALLLYGADANVVDDCNRTAQACVSDDDVVGKQIFENHRLQDLSPPAYEETESPTTVCMEGTRCYNCDGAIDLASDAAIHKASPSDTTIRASNGCTTEAVVRETDRPTDRTNDDASNTANDGTIEVASNGTTMAKGKQDEQEEPSAKSNIESHGISPTTSCAVTDNMDSNPHASSDPNHQDQRRPKTKSSDQDKHTVLRPSRILPDRVTVKQRLVLNDGRVIYHTVPKAS